jgi:hypothetical protein
MDSDSREGAKPHFDFFLERAANHSNYKEDAGACFFIISGNQEFTSQERLSDTEALDRTYSFGVVPTLRGAREHRSRVRHLLGTIAAVFRVE